MKIGDKVRKIKGYKFVGTVIGMGQKSDHITLVMVEAEPSDVVEGIVHIFRVSDLEVI